jgi:putative ABC transport system permease protein
VLLDVRFGLRMLVRHPGFAAVAILTLAIGLGATVTKFSVVNGVLRKPLPYADSDRLVALSAASPRATAPMAVSPGDFLDWQAQNRTFADMAAFTMSRYTLTGGGEPLRVFAGVVTPRFADLLGVRPMLGRSLDGDALANGTLPVVISARLWRSHFRMDPRTVGTGVAIDGEPYTIVGVMPDGFSFPREIAGARGTGGVPDVDVWVPLTLRPGYRANAFLQVIARLRPGVAIEQARADMASIAAAIADRFPENRDIGVRIVALRERIVAGVRRLLYTLFGAVALLLIIACANVANLLLARAIGRDREAAIRSALGSGRRRLIQQHITESLLLGVCGGVAGILVAAWGVKLVAALIPDGTLPRLQEVRIDAGVVAFTTFVSLIAGVVFGTAPAIHTAATDVMTAIKGLSPSYTRQSRTLGGLVVAQVALAFALLASCGLLLRSFWRLTSVDPGFRPDRVLAVDVTLPEATYPTLTEMRAFASSVLARIRATPGVSEAGAVNLLPIGGSLLSGDFIVENVPGPLELVAVKPSVSPGYFRAMGIRLLRGRDFDIRDQRDAPGVAIVTDNLARRVWPGQEPVGKRLKLGFGEPVDDPWLTVVGVVADVKQTALDDESKPAIDVPIDQAPRPFLLREMSFVVRTGADPRALAASIRDDLRFVDPLLPIGRAATMTDLIDTSIAAPRFRAVLVASFAVSALALITIGMVGVLGCTVARRTREIGVRMALGAQRADVVGLVVGQALTMSLVGIAAGAALALAATQVLAAFLFEISARDPATFAAAAMILTALTLVASYVPARRAAGADPLAALRAE